MSVEDMIASISVPNASYKSSYLHIRVHVFCMLKKEKDLHEVSMFTFTKFFFPVLLNLGAQIRCAWNRCTAVQTDLKYPLVMLCKTGIWLGILHLIRDRRFWKMANPVHKYQKLIIKTENVYGLCPIDSIFWLVGQC